MVSNFQRQIPKSASCFDNLLYGFSPIRPQTFEQHSISRMHNSFTFLQILIKRKRERGLKNLRHK